MSPACDVVVATRNRPDRLKRCLAGLREQTYTDFRVIVVDDASDVPATSQVSESDLRDLEVRFVRLDRQSGPAAARNAGVAAGDARYIVFIDDDVRPDARLLEVHIAAVEAAPDGRVVSCGPFIAPHDWNPTPWNLWEARQALKEADALTQGVYPPTWRQFHTGNNCLTRATFEEAGGFDVAFTRAEDDEFALRLHRLGCRFVFRREAIAWHYSERTLAAWLSIPSAYAHFDIRIDDLYPDEGYLPRKLKELNERHPLLVAVRRATSGRSRRKVAITASTIVARGLFRLGAVAPSMFALSTAWDLAYSGTLTEEMSARPPMSVSLTGGAAES